MARLSSIPINLTIRERKELRRIRDFHPKKWYWVRADIVLRAAVGQSNLVIARKLKISRNTVKHWRYRFAREGMAGLKTRPIPGRPRRAREVRQGAAECNGQRVGSQAETLALKQPETALP